MLLSVAALLLLAARRGSWAEVAGDESTFLAMTESLVSDGDLEFTNADLARLEATERPARKTLILQRSGARVAYSKPVVYPLLAAPLVALLGRPGMAALNGLAIAGALVLVWTILRDRKERGAWALTLATFAGAGALLPQIAWSMGDALQFAFALAGAALCLGGPRRVRSVWMAAAGGALLGPLIAMRPPNAIVVVAVVAAVAASGRVRRALAAAGGAAAALVLVLGLSSALIGAANPYRAERATFNLATGYPAGADAARALEQFDAGRATQRLGLRPAVRPRVSAYSSLYFLAGRHTGLLVYFPLALVLFGAAVPGAGREQWALLAGAAGLAAFYLIWMPDNYFGGASFVGNRYVLPALALLPLAVRRPPRAGWLIGVWVLSAVSFLSALHSVERERGKPFSSQSHAYSGIFRLLPYESTALAIEDREDRYLSDEFLRFVDGNAEVTEHRIYLDSGRQPAEILLATPRPSGVLRFLVWVDTPGAALVFRDWRGAQRFELASHGRYAGGLIEVVAAPAWRRHPFWWTPANWRAHLIRLSIEAPAGIEARADVRHLGPYRLAAKFFAYAADPVELPSTVAAGGTSILRVALVNRGRRPWASEADVPIHLVRRMWPEGSGADGEPAIGFTSIDREVARGERLELEFDQRWPRRPGRYRFELDLAAGGVELFGGWLGASIASGVVEVVAGQAEPDAVVSSR